MKWLDDPFNKFYAAIIFIFLILLSASLAIKLAQVRMENRMITIRGCEIIGSDYIHSKTKEIK